MLLEIEEMNSKILHFSYLLILLPALYTGFYPGKIVFVSAFCMILYFVFVVQYHKFWNFSELDGKRVISFFILFSIFSYVRSFFNVDSWRDYVAIFSGFFSVVFYPIWILLAKEKYLPVIFKSCMTLGVVAGVVAAIN